MRGVLEAVGLAIEARRPKVEERLRDVDQRLDALHQLRLRLAPLGTASRRAQTPAWTYVHLRRGHGWAPEKARAALLRNLRATG